MSKSKAYRLFDGSATRAALLPGAGRGAATGRFVAGRDADGRLCACDGMALAYVPETGFWNDRRIAGVMEIVRAGGVGSMGGVPDGRAVPMSPDAIDQIVRGSLRGETGAGVVMPDVSGAVWVGDAVRGERGAWVDAKYAGLLAGGLAAWTGDGVAVSLACVNEDSGLYGRVIVRSAEDGEVVLIVAGTPEPPKSNGRAK